MGRLQLLSIILWISALLQWQVQAVDQVVLSDQAFQLPEAAKNVAITGAGSGGSATAYYLRKFADDAGIALNLTIFERDSYVGGRSTTVGVYDDIENPVELGASIFVKVNQILVNASEEFKLTTTSLARGQSEGPMLGVWNGQDFVFVQAGGRGWWDTAKLFWKYGLAPLKTLNLMKATVGQFLKMYDEYFPFQSLTEAVHDLELVTATSSTGEQFLKANGIGDLFAQDVIQASTRVNYAQNLPLIHGLETMVCMATDGAMSVEGGNWQIFAHMIEASGAMLRLNTTVTHLQRSKDGSYTIAGQEANDNLGRAEYHDQPFDEVVLAAPQQFTNIKFDPEPQHIPDSIPYVKLHVTLFTSKHLLSPLAFNLPPDTPVPQVILTTLPPNESYGSNPSGVGSPGFFSISLLQPTMDTRLGKNQLEYVYKIFSPTPVNSTFLSHILGLSEHEASQEISEEDVSWMYRKVWDSYPYEYPRVTFEEMRLDEGLWYTSGIESFISTMETSALMGRNVAKLMVEKWQSERAAEMTIG